MVRTRETQSILVSSLLVASENSGDAIRRLFHHKKSLVPTVSLGTLCRAIGLSSRGYLGDVIKGRRLLNETYLDSIAAYFDLDETQGQLLRLLLQRDRCKTTEEHSELDARVTTQRAVLTIRHASVPAETRALFLALDVFAAFGITGNVTNLDTLQALFPRTERNALEESLLFLAKLQLMEVREDGTYRLRSDHAQLAALQAQIPVREYFRTMLESSARIVETHFEKRDEALFGCFAVSVKKEQLVTKLPKVRALMNEMVVLLESNEADTLLRLNLAVHLSS